MIGGFWIFPEGHRHGQRGPDHHIVDPAAVGFHRYRLAPYGIGAARPGDHGRHPRLQRFPEAAVLWVDRVDRPELGGGGVGIFVPVVPLEAQAVLPHPDVGMGVDQPGKKPASSGVQLL